MCKIDRWVGGGVAFNTYSNYKDKHEYNNKKEKESKYQTEWTKREILQDFAMNKVIPRTVGFWINGLRSTLD